MVSKVLLSSYKMFHTAAKNIKVISKINPTRGTILFNIFIYFSALHVSGIHVPIIRSKYCIHATLVRACHSVWVASGLLTSRPYGTHTE